MATTIVPLGSLSTIGIHIGEKFRIYPTPMSTLTARMKVAVPYDARQAPQSSRASTISGFELGTSKDDKHSQASTSASGQLTPASASVVSDLDDPAIHIPSQCSCAAMEARIEQLLEENEILAQELRDLHTKRRQRKERKSKEKKAKLHTKIVREVLRFMTAVMMPMPERSAARFVVMAVEAFWLRERVSVS